MAELKRRHREPRPPAEDIDPDTFVGRAVEVEVVQTPSTALMAIDQARQALEIAANLDDVKDIRDRAEAMRAYAKQAQYSLEIQNRCAELKLRAERKAGTLLKDATVKGGERHKSHDGTYDRRSVLDDLGISKMQSSRWQAVAALPETVFEQHIARVTQSARELTSSSVLRLATLYKKMASDQPPEEQSKELPNGAIPEDVFLDRTDGEFLEALGRLKEVIINAKESKWQSVSQELVIQHLNELLAMVTQMDDV